MEYADVELLCARVSFTPPTFVWIRSGASSPVLYLLLWFIVGSQFRCRHTKQPHTLESYQEIQHWTWCITMDSNHVMLGPNKMSFSRKENVQGYLSYTVIQCFPNTFLGSGSSANHNKTESVQTIREKKFPVYSFLYLYCMMLSKII